MRYHGAYSWFGEIPGAAGYLFEVVVRGCLAMIVWGAMAERAKLRVYFGAPASIVTVIYSVTSHWIWSPQGWLFKGTLADKIGLGATGMQDFAGSTVVHHQGALAALAGAIILAADRQVRPRRPRTDPGSQHSVSPASGRSSSGSAGSASTPARTLRSVDFGGFGSSGGYVRDDDEHPWPARRWARRDHHRVDRPEEARHLDDAERRARSARGDHRRIRLRRPLGGGS